MCGTLPGAHSEEYRRGYRDACGHYPGCSQRLAHTQGATHCWECGAEFRLGVYRVVPSPSALGSATFEFVPDA